MLAAGQSIQPDKEGKPQLGAGGDLPGHARAGGDAGPGLPAGEHPARAAQPAGHHASEDHGHADERADGRAGRAATVARRPGGNRAPVAAAPQPSQQVVEVYRGGVRTLMKF